MLAAFLSATSTLRLAVAAASTKMHTEDQAKLFRFTFDHSILLASVIGIITFIYSRM